jgi:hypothetical protein
MNNDLTINAIPFVLQYSDKTGSLRRNVSRGINLPTDLRISHNDAVESSTKLKTRRSMVRFDRHVELSSGVIAPVSLYVVAVVPQDSAVTSDDTSALAFHLQNFLYAAGGNTSGLDLIDNVIDSKEQ